MSNPRTTLHMAKGSQVSPIPGTFIDHKMRLNARWLFSLKPDRLLAPLRENCGLDTLGCKYYSGWKDYYHHYTRSMYNLYISFRGIDDKIAEEAKARAIYMIHGVLECQKKTAELIPEADGMITPEMETLFMGRTRLERDSIYSHTHIESIMYVIHKVTLNFVHMYRIFGLTEALEGAKKVARRVHAAMSPFTQQQRERMTDSRRAEEFFSEAGGIMDAFLQLYAETGDPEHLETASFFRRSWFDRMFTEDDDKLAYGMEHANSEMPYVESLVDMYVLTGDESALKAARGYMHANYVDHELPQGSVSGRSAFPDYQSELYNYPKRVFFHIMDTPARKNITSGESCCAHNLNRVAKKLLEVEADVELMDAWERRYINAVLSQQNPDTGMFIYNLNLKNNTYKMWGYPEKSFWCCYGTGAEVHASLTEGAFYEDAGSAIACLYMPCVYTHKATGITITETTRYPDDGEIKFTVSGSGALSLKLRIPGWLAEPAAVTLPDGETVSVDAKGVLYEISREWKDGDTVTLNLPFALRYDCMPDRHEYVSVTYGPNLLVPCAPGEVFFSGDGDALLKALEPTGVPCHFVTDFQGDGTGGSHVLKPLRLIKDETYSGYVRVTEPTEEVIADELYFGREQSRTAHNLHGVGMQISSDRGHTRVLTSLTFFSEKGEIIFDMASDPAKEMILRLYLDGSAKAYIHQFSGHICNPLFDLQVMHDGEWKTFSTKSMEADFPGEIYYENFVIPAAWTNGKDRLQLRLIARNFHEIPGVIETLMDKVTLFSAAKTTGTLTDLPEIYDKGEKEYVPNALGL